MNRSSARIGLLVLLGLFLFPYRSPAPLIYRPGEGWSYETPGAKGDWRKQTAREQLTVAQEGFDKKQYRFALKAAKRVISVWPLSDSAPKAQYLIGRCYEARKMDELAFKAYQTLFDKPEYAKRINSADVQRRQFAIAVRFLHGEWFKLWGYIPFFPSMDKTADMFEKINHFGPYGELGPVAEMDVGAAREKEKDFPSAAKAYEQVSDRYADQPKLAADAKYKEAMAYDKQSKKADYDQSMAGQKFISTFTDFMALYPDDSRVPDAGKIIVSLKEEEALGNFHVAEYYAKQKKWDGALVYYNEVMLTDAGSPLAAQARKRIEELKKRGPTKSIVPTSSTPWNQPSAPSQPIPSLPGNQTP